MKPAKMLKISVTRDIIDNAIQKNSRHCMLADAVVAHFGGPAKCQYPRVDIRRGVAFTLAATGERHYYPIIPQEAALNLRVFDTVGAKAIKPFNMVLSKGWIQKAGWKGSHPHATRRGRTYRRGGTRAIPMPPKERIVGIQLY